MSKNNETRRRDVLKAIGLSATIGFTGLSATQSAAADSTGATRNRYSGSAADSALETALASAELQAVAEAIPGKSNRLVTDEFEAYEIVVEGTDGGSAVRAEYTQVVIPVRGGESDLVFATDGEQNSVGVELESGRYAYCNSMEEGLRHKHLPGAAVEARAVAAVRGSADFAELSERIPASSSVKFGNASVSVVEETGYATVAVPIAGATDAANGVLVGTVDTSTDQIVTIQASYWSCVANCLALSSPAFYGACAPICSPCAVVPSQFTCAPCAACLGIALVACGGRCLF